MSLSFISIKSGKTIAAIGALIALVALVGYFAMPREVEVEHAPQIARVSRDASQQTPARGAVTTREPIAAETPASPIELRFKVQDESGEPFVDREFSVSLLEDSYDRPAYDDSEQYQKSVGRTDSAGEFAVPLTTAVTWAEVHLLEERMQFLNASGEWNESARIDIKDYKGVPVPLQVRNHVFLAHCTFVDAVPLPAGQRIDLKITGRRETLLTGITDSFSFEAERGRPYWITVTKNHADQPEIVDRCLVTKIQMPDTAEDWHFELKLNDGARLNGSITYPDGSPVAGLRVIASSGDSDVTSYWHGVERAQVVSNETDEDGTWTVDLPRGDFFSYYPVDADGIRRDLLYPKNSPDRLPYAHPHESGMRPFPTTFEASQIKIVIDETILVEGSVTNPDDSPCAGALIIEYSRWNREGSSRGVTDPEGNFAFRIPPYRVRGGQLQFIAWGDSGIGATQFDQEAKNYLSIKLAPLVTVDLPRPQVEGFGWEVDLDLQNGGKPTNMIEISSRESPGFGVDTEHVDGEADTIRFTNVPAGASRIVFRERREDYARRLARYRISADGEAVLLPQ